MTKKLNKKKVYFILAILTAVLAFGTAFAYIMNSATDTAEGDTIHGTEIGIVVEFDNFADQILIPQNAIATETGETDTLNITGTIKLSADADIAVAVVLSYEILVNEQVSTALFTISNATTSLDVDSVSGEDFSLDVSLIAGEKLGDGDAIKVVVTAVLAD